MGWERLSPPRPPPSCPRAEWSDPRPALHPLPGAGGPAAWTQAPILRWVQPPRLGPRDGLCHRLRACVGLRLRLQAQGLLPAWDPASTQGTPGRGDAAGQTHSGCGG